MSADKVLYGHKRRLRDWPIVWLLKLYGYEGYILDDDWKGEIR